MYVCVRVSTIAILIHCLSWFRSIRFRWDRGYVNNNESIPSEDADWAINQVYFGPQCADHCNGRGTCADAGATCLCDDGYIDDACQITVRSNSQHLHQVFHGLFVILQLTESLKLKSNLVKVDDYFRNLAKFR